MKKMMFVTGAGMLALAMTGCRTVETKTVLYPATTAGGVSVTASPGMIVTPQPVQVTGVGARPTAVDLRPAQTQIATASAVLEQVRVRVRPVAAGQDATQVATLLGNGVQGALAAANYKVVYDGPAELYADLGVTCEPLNARGTRVVYKGDVDATVTRSPEFNAITKQVMTDMVARNRFDVQGAPGRGAGDALKSVADKMATTVSPWLADACVKVGGKAEICMVTIANAWFLSSHSEYPTLFTQRVRALAGVYDCTILATDNVNRTLQARIVYDRDRFPDGIINRLYTIEELNIHR
ncbi:MAG: hypothetical protein WCK89_02680 [bacterium]